MFSQMMLEIELPLITNTSPKVQLLSPLGEPMSHLVPQYPVSVATPCFQSHPHASGVELGYPRDYHRHLARGRPQVRFPGLYCLTPSAHLLFLRVRLFHFGAPVAEERLPVARPPRRPEELVRNDASAPDNVSHKEHRLSRGK